MANKSLFHQWPCTHSVAEHLLWASLSLKLQGAPTTLIPWTFNVASLKPSSILESGRSRSLDGGIGRLMAFCHLTTTEAVFLFRGDRWKNEKIATSLPMSVLLEEEWTEERWNKKWRPKSVVLKTAYKVIFPSRHHCLQHLPDTYHLPPAWDNSRTAERRWKLGNSMTAMSATSTEVTSSLIGQTCKFSAPPK